MSFSDFTRAVEGYTRLHASFPFCQAPTLETYDDFLVIFWQLALCIIMTVSNLQLARKAYCNVREHLLVRSSVSLSHVGIKISEDIVYVSLPI